MSVSPINYSLPFCGQFCSQTACARGLKVTAVVTATLLLCVGLFLIHGALGGSASYLEIFGGVGCLVGGIIAHVIASCIDGGSKAEVQPTVKALA